MKIFTPKSKILLWELTEGYITTKSSKKLLYILDVLANVSQSYGSNFVFTPKSETPILNIEYFSDGFNILTPKSLTKIYRVTINNEDIDIFTPKSNKLLYKIRGAGDELGDYVYTPKSETPVLYIEGLTFLRGGHGNESDENFMLDFEQVCGETNITTFNQISLNINNITTQNTQRPQTIRGLPCAGVIIHHTAGGSLAGAISTLRNNNLSYHYLIESNGNISQFTNNNVRGHHAGGQQRPTQNNWGSDPNTVTIGIAFVGNFVSSNPSQASLDACANLIRNLVQNNVIVGNLTGNRTQTVVAGHFCNRATACPGNVPFGNFRDFYII
jgi:hypothetical protein